MDLSHEYTRDVMSRFRYLAWILAAMFIVVVARLYYLQVIKGAQYYFFSEQNSIKEMEIPALRGIIFDRNNEPLVDNRAAFDITITPQFVSDKAKTFSSVAKLLKMDEAEVVARFEKGKGLPSYYPVPIKEDASSDDVAAVKAHKSPWYDKEDEFDLRGVDVKMRYARLYPDGESASHLLGYMREVDAKKLEQFKKNGLGGYKMGDFVGIGGVEEMWDEVLRGRDGFDQKVVNAIGREVIWPDIDLIKEKPLNGGTVHLTVDAKLQKVAKEALSGRKGAVVAIDPRDGSVLALYSSPPMELNVLSSPEGSSYWRKVANDPEKPLYNRAIQGTYPPASTYKIVTASAALGEGAITETSTIACPGGLHFGGRLYRCWRKGGHGAIGVVKSLAASCDTFFYQLGLRLGVDVIAKYAKSLGLGHLTKIDLPQERSGLIPTSQWKLDRFKVPWQAGENISISVGQGYDTVTPLQNAVMIATVANGGKKITPHVTDYVTDSRGREVFRWKKMGDDEQVLDPKVIAVVKKGLEGVVDSPEGTGHRLSLLKLKIAGKTGTAQVISMEKWKAGVEKLKDHAWFVGYAPYDDPKIAVATVVENGGFGASAAAPVVGKIIQKYLESEK